ncbi:hypothetical protein Q5752_004779 [Cryptotrichosporon argae]
MSVLPAVTLDFSRKAADAWDDSELVLAYDAAMKEFHIHHPGPGSWLDKATAALARGLPLPGASAYGTSWYTAYEPESSARGVKRAEPASASAGRPAKRGNTGVHTRPAQAQANPYASATPDDRAQSPTYQPTSPGAEGAGEAGENEGDGDGDGAGGDDGDGENEEGGGEGGEGGAEHWQGYDGFGLDYAQGGAWGDEAAQQGVFPPPQAAWPVPAQVEEDEALGYAMNAQYWAGYWMGLVRGRREEGIVGPPGSVVPSANGAVLSGEAASLAASTRQVNGYRR